MLQRIFFSMIFFCGITISSHSQSLLINKPKIDSLRYQKQYLEGKTGPEIIIKANPIFIVNQIIIKDSLKIKKFRKKYESDIKRIKYYNKLRTKKKFGIENEDGAIFIRTKKNVIIDL